MKLGTLEEKRLCLLKTGLPVFIFQMCWTSILLKKELCTCVCLCVRERERERDMVPIILWLWLTTTASVAASPQSRPGCQESCGNVVIPYPFGIGANCSFDEGFVVTCNDTFNPPKPFIKSMNLEVLQISINGTVQVNNPVITSNCPGRTNGLDLFLEFPFSFSDTYNRFTAMGCNNLALITRQDTIITGCMSICNVSSTLQTGCFGISCCQTTIPPFLKFINASLRSIDPNKDQNDCKYAFMVDYQWFRDKDIYAARDMEYVPAVLDWTINGTCINGTNSSTGSFCGANAYCSRNQTWSSRCYCESGYEGNPYLSSGCQGKVQVLFKYQNRKAYFDAWLGYFLVCFFDIALQILMSA